MILFILTACIIALIIMYVYLNYKFNRKLEITKLMLDRSAYMFMYGSKYSPEIISAELTKNNDEIIRTFDKYNKSDLAALSKLLHNDSLLFLEVAKSGGKDNDKIKLWKSNATELADKLNEIDDRKWSNLRGEQLLHEYQNSIISSFSEGLKVFDSIRDNAVKVGLFIS